MNCFDSLFKDAGDEWSNWPVESQMVLSDRYRIVRKIGHGGMGVVYEANDNRNNNAPCAIKFEHIGASGKDRAGRFAAESQVLSEIKNVPGLIRINEVGTANQYPFDGKTFIVTDLYKGPADDGKLVRLRDYLNCTRLDKANAVRIVERCAIVLARVHEKQTNEEDADTVIVHRDLKPENILLSPAAEPGLPFDTHIIDFGLAARTLSETAGTSAGTFAYMAPEQLNKQKAGPAVDIWSLGVILFEILSGQKPFQPDSGAGEAELHQMQLQTAQKPAFEQIRDGRLRRICMGCLAIDPDQRPTAQGLVDSLEKYRRKLPLPGDSMAVGIWLWCIRHTITALTLAAVFLLCLGGYASWDAFYAEHREFYETFVRKWGEPVGVGRVSASEQKQRLRTICLIRYGRFGHVSKLQVLNPFGYLISDSRLSDSLLPPVIAVSEIQPDVENEIVFDFDERGRIFRETGRGSKGDMYKIEYVQTSSSPRNPEEVICTYREVNKTTSLRRSQAGACKLRIQRTAEGFDRRVSFLNDAEEPTTDARGCSVIVRSFSIDGGRSPLPSVEEYLDAAGKPLYVDGYAKACRQYDDRGRITSIDYLNHVGKICAHEDRYTGLRSEWNTLGTEQQVRFVEPGSTVEAASWHSKGYCGYRIRTTVDSVNRSIQWEQTFLDDRLKPICSSDHYAICRLTMSADGKPKALEYLNEEGLPVRTRYNFAAVAFSDRNPNLTLRFLDVKGTPIRKGSGSPQLNPNAVEPAQYFVLNLNGASVGMDDQSELQVQARGKSTRISSKSPNGSRSASESPPLQPVQLQKTAYQPTIAKPVSDDNIAQDLRATVEALSEKSQSTDNAESGPDTTSVELQRDDRGQLQSLTYYNNDRPFQTTTWTYDPQFLHVWVREECRQEQTLQNNSWGYAVRTREIDERGNWTREDYQRIDNQNLIPGILGASYTSKTRTYNSRGTVTEEAFWNASGRVEGPQGYAATRFTDNERGALCSIEFTDKNGEQTAVSGFARGEILRDPLGRINGSLGSNYRNGTGYHSKRVELDHQGRSVREFFLDRSGASVEIDGAASFEIVRDRNGNVIEGRYLNSERNLTRSSLGYVYFKSEFDSDRNEIRRLYYDANGAPVAASTGEWGWIQSYDAQNREEERTFLGRAGSPGFYSDSKVLGFRNTWSDRGLLLSTEFRFLDESIGVTACRLHFEIGDRNRIQRAEFLKDGILTPRADGVAYWTQKLDSVGRIRERRHYDLSGGLTLNVDGAAIERHLYDDNGNEVRREFLGIDESPVVIRSGYAAWVAEYLRGNQTAKRFLSPDGTEARCEEGYSSYSVVYNDLNLPVTKRWDGNDPASTGYSTNICRYDGTADERLLEQTFLDEQGRPVRCKLGYHKLNIEYRDGLQSIRRFEGCDVAKLLTVTD